MKRYFKSWAQSLIFVLIITLAVPFGMMGFAETTETSITKTAELMYGEVKLGSYTATLNEDKSSIALDLEMEDDFILTSVKVRLETTTSDAIAFESSVVPIETTFEFDINEFEEFDIVVEVEATREEVVGVRYEENFEDYFGFDDNDNIKGNIHFSFTSEYEIFISRKQLEGLASAYFVNEISFSDYLEDKSNGNDKGNGNSNGNNSVKFKGRLALLESDSVTAAHANEIHYLVNNREDLSEDEVQEIIWNLLGNDIELDGDTLNTIKEESESFELKPDDLFAVIMEPFKADSVGGTDGDTETNDFDKFITLIKLTDSAFNEIDVIETVNYEAEAKVDFNLENEDQNPETGAVDDNSTGDSNGPGNDGDEDEAVVDDTNEDDGSDDNGETSEDEQDADDAITDQDDDDNDGSNGSGGSSVGDDQEQDEEQDENLNEEDESPSGNSDSDKDDKENEKNDGTKQDQTITKPTEIVVEAPTPMGSSASVETPVNVPVETEELEDLEEVTEPETPRGNPALDKLPKTGEIPPYAYYAAGTLLLGLGVGLRKKF